MAPISRLRIRRKRNSSWNFSSVPGASRGGPMRGAYFIVSEEIAMFLRPRQHLFDDLDKVGSGKRLDQPAGSSQPLSLVTFGGFAFSGKRQDRNEAKTGQCTGILDQFHAPPIGHFAFSTHGR